MKRVVTIVSAFLLVLGLSVASSAAFGLEGTYVTGTQTYTITGLPADVAGSANGFALIARASVLGPFGAEAHYTSLKGDDLEMSTFAVGEGTIAKTDLFLTLQPHAALKLFAGYSEATTTLAFAGPLAGQGTQETTVSGPTAGLQAGLRLTERLTMGGYYGVGFGMKYDDGSETGDADVTSYKVAVNYELNPTLTLEAGYASDTCEYPDVKAEVTAYFVGAKATF